MSLGILLGPILIKAFGLTWRLKQSCRNYFERRMEGASKRVVYSFWHQDILLLIYFGRYERSRVLISQHRDGELIARIVEKLGYSTYRGSTTRGGMKALRAFDKIKEDPSKYDIGLTPDGPKGPPKKLKKGIIFAASRTGFPIVPFGVAVDRSWRLKSWDRFRIPKPFSKCFVHLGPEIPVPPDLDDQGMKTYSNLVEQAMAEAEEQAEEALKNWREMGIRSKKFKKLKSVSV